MAGRVPPEFTVKLIEERLAALEARVAKLERNQKIAAGAYNRPLSARTQAKKLRQAVKAKLSEKRSRPLATR
jgi:hypothetical protein